MELRAGGRLRTRGRASHPARAESCAHEAEPATAASAEDRGHEAGPVTWPGGGWRVWPGAGIRAYAVVALHIARDSRGCRSRSDGPLRRPRARSALAGAEDCTGSRRTM